MLGAFLAAAVRESRRARPDLVHAHWVLPGGVVALALHGLFGVPYIVTAHAADIFRLRTRPPGPQAPNRRPGSVRSSGQRGGS